MSLSFSKHPRQGDTSNETSGCDLISIHRKQHLCQGVKGPFLVAPLNPLLMDLPLLIQLLEYIGIEHFLVESPIESFHKAERFNELGTLADGI